MMRGYYILSNPSPTPSIGSVLKMFVMSLSHLWVTGEGGATNLYLYILQFLVLCLYIYESNCRDDILSKQAYELISIPSSPYHRIIQV